MKTILPFLVLLLAFTSAFGQDTITQRSIIRELQTQKQGEGTVIINQPEALETMVGKHAAGPNVKLQNNKLFIETSGYRVQVFSGNNQRKSKDEAFAKEKLIKEEFPELDTHVTFNSPFWRLRVGNFRSYEEAHQTMMQLRGNFPKFGKEMYIVRDRVKFPIQDNQIHP